jgi:AraC-like DNA-binding protein
VYPPKARSCVLSVFFSAFSGFANSLLSSCCIFMRKPAEGGPVKYLRAIGYREGDEAAAPCNAREYIDGKSIVQTALECSAPGPLFFLSFVYSNRDVGFGCFAMKKENPMPFFYSPVGSGHLFTEKISEKLGDVIEGIQLFERMKEQTERVRETAKERKNVELIYEKINLTEEKAAHYFRDLLIFMETKKPFKDDDITLLRLSKLLNISRNQLSFIINENSGVNFYDFLNTYRVENAIRLMDRKKDDSERILDIALKAGLKSKSTFNKVFKKHTGRTPKEYRDDPQ